MTRGMVVCPMQEAADAGAHVLRLGGNAVDAAIAAAFAQAVVGNIFCGLGGSGEFLIYLSAERKLIQIECGSEVPKLLVPSAFRGAPLGRFETIGRYVVEGERNQIGYLSVMVPGIVKGLADAFDKFGSGSVSWDQLLLPAQQLAFQGFRLTPHMASVFAIHDNPSHYDNKPGYPSLKRKTEENEALRRLVAPEGCNRHPGELIVQKELGQTLVTLACEGPNSFYTGRIAEKIAAEFRAHDGAVTADDLADYRSNLREPVVVSYRDNEVAVGALPSDGMKLAEMLLVADRIDLSGDWRSVEYLVRLAKIMARAFYDQREWKGCVVDSPAAQEAQEWLLSEQNIADAAREVLSEACHPPISPARPSLGTTHVTTCDEHGNAVSLTHSAGGPGASGILADGLGFTYNNFIGSFNPEPDHPDSIRPKARMGGLCPAFFLEDGRPRVALGAPGGSRIVTSVLQSLLHCVLGKASVQTAVSLPRIHCEESDLIYAEPQIPEALLAGLECFGYRVIQSAYSARVQAIAWTERGIEAGSDPRGGMGVAVV